MLGLGVADTGNSDNCLVPIWLKLSTLANSDFGGAETLLQRKTARALLLIVLRCFVVTMGNAWQSHTSAFGLGNVHDDVNNLGMLRYYAEQAAPYAARQPGKTDAAHAALMWQQRLLAATQ